MLAVINRSPFRAPQLSIPPSKVYTHKYQAVQTEICTRGFSSDAVDLQYAWMMFHSVQVRYGGAHSACHWPLRPRGISTLLRAATGARSLGLSARQALHQRSNRSVDVFSPTLDFLPDPARFVWRLLLLAAAIYTTKLADMPVLDTDR